MKREDGSAERGAGDGSGSASAGGSGAGSARRREIEPAGILYDRHRLDLLAQRLVREHGLGTVLELPAGGAKAMPSLYSLGFARAGCAVHLFNPDWNSLPVWERLGLWKQVAVREGKDPTHTAMRDGAYDLVWNFVTAGTTGRLPDYLREMRRLAKGLVLTVHCSGWNWGYPWHRLLHRVFDLPWTHGPAEAFFPARVEQQYRAAQLAVVETGFCDMPFWPDPPGFRDVRLHRAGVDPNAAPPDVDWESPIEAYYLSGELPPLLRVLSRVEDLPWPRPLRLVFSHLFYVLGRK